MRPRTIGLLVVLAAWTCSHPAQVQGKAGFGPKQFVAEAGELQTAKTYEFDNNKNQGRRILHGDIYIHQNSADQAVVALRIDRGNETAGFNAAFVHGFDDGVDDLLEQLRFHMGIQISETFFPGEGLTAEPLRLHQSAEWFDQRRGLNVQGRVTIQLR